MRIIFVIAYSARLFSDEMFHEFEQEFAQGVTVELPMPELKNLATIEEQIAEYSRAATSRDRLAYFIVKEVRLPQDE
jgi:hypothetical protein